MQGIHLVIQDEFFLELGRRKKEIYGLATDKIVMGCMGRDV